MPTKTTKTVSALLKPSLLPPKVADVHPFSSNNDNFSKQYKVKFYPKSMSNVISTARYTNYKTFPHHSDPSAGLFSSLVSY